MGSAIKIEIEVEKKLKHCRVQGCHFKLTSEWKVSKTAKLKFKSKNLKAGYRSKEKQLEYEYTYLQYLTGEKSSANKQKVSVLIIILM